jgi:hypothetical protein
MTKVIIVVREPGKLKLDYSLEFDLPEIPRVGSYISIHRPDKPQPFGEDVVVRKVWWRLEHPDTGTGAGSAKAAKIGSVAEVFVECDIAVGPYASDRWREMAATAKARGAVVEEFEVERYSIREKDINR